MKTSHTTDPTSEDEIVVIVDDVIIHNTSTLLRGKKRRIDIYESAEGDNIESVGVLELNEDFTLGPDPKSPKLKCGYQYDDDSGWWQLVEIEVFPVPKPKEVPERTEER